MAVDLTGTQIGTYRILERIGAGGMGSVWLAEHAVLGRRAALKVLHPVYSAQPEYITRFFNEARAATAISDPGIVQVFDFGKHEDGSAYIVMELLAGETLQGRLAERGPFSVRDALRVVRQTAGSLGAAHAAGIIHRDLKPDNIFIVRDPEVTGGERAKIVDFGIAKLSGDLTTNTATAAVFGTPQYMSPEQCRGAGQVDQRSDVYAVGCVLFTLLTGRAPFEAEGAGEVIAMHLVEPAPVPSTRATGIPPEVDALVARCLAKDPAQRFADGTELAAALDVLLANPAVASPSRTPAAMPRAVVASAHTTLSTAAGITTEVGPKPGRRFAWLGLGVGVAALAAMSIWWMQRGPSTAEPAAPPPAPDLHASVAAEIRATLARFVTWSRDHRGAACPDMAAIGATEPDPWGHPLALTCTEQPGDQIVGVSSAGPDGLLGTPDDIASWQLGREVTASVDGPRWTAAAAPPPPSPPPPPPAPLPPAVLPPRAKPVKTHPQPARAAPSKPAADHDDIPTER